MATKSALPSPFRSPTATALAYLPGSVSLFTGGRKDASPSPNSTDTCGPLVLELAETRSRLPSPLKSALASDTGDEPVK